MTDAELFAEGERILAKDHSKKDRWRFEDWERVTTPVRNPNPPTTIRMAPNFLKRRTSFRTARTRPD